MDGDDRGAGAAHSRHPGRRRRGVVRAQAEQPPSFGLGDHLLVGCRVVRQRHRQPGVVKVGRLELFVLQPKASALGQVGDGVQAGRGDHDHVGSDLQQAGHPSQRHRASTHDHDAATPDPEPEGQQVVDLVTASIGLPERLSSCQQASARHEDVVCADRRGLPGAA
jgi:hypothetical protein